MYRYFLRRSLMMYSTIEVRDRLGRKKKKFFRREIKRERKKKKDVVIWRCMPSSTV